ncbi:tyrosine phosphatase family protein [Magnetospirillum sp. UT-4]|uniref:tyrosine phosphatase family protein n=1 Tax=Magnetospirillum sp. UT-4 TaxID=2681467 RepID=UPI001571C52E|nr:protein-tyrosine-phosphatase [Magnetospirillum sp. UT-4]
MVPYKITICGLTELCLHGEAGITHVLTILDPDHPDPDDFRAYPPHRRTVWRYHDIVAEKDEMVAPQAADVSAILAFGAQTSGIDHLLIHCHMGISRSTATAVILMAQSNPGQEEAAFAELRRIRPRSWPNSRMIGFADRLLERNGALVAAMKGHHATVAAAEPGLADLLRQSERAGEVP